MGFLVSGLTNVEKKLAVGKLQTIAAKLDCGEAQLAIAWSTNNPRVSTVINGASSLAQLQHTMAAVDLLPKLSAQVLAEINAISTPLAD